MSTYRDAPATEGYFGVLPSGTAIYPNRAPFYLSAEAARRETRGGKVFKATVTFEEVES